MDLLKVLKQKLQIPLVKLTECIREIPIFFRLVISFLLVIVIPSVIIGFVSYNISTAEIENNLYEYTSQYIRNINNNITEKLKRYEELALDICNDETIYPILAESNLLYAVKQYQPDLFEKYPEFKKDINNKLYSYGYNDSYISNIEIITEYDEYTQKSIFNNQVKGGKIKDSNLFRKSVPYKTAMEANGELIWCDIDSNTFIKQAIENYYISDNIMLLRAIPNEKGGNPLGVIIITVFPNLFIDTYQATDIIEKGNLLLLSDKGVMVSINQRVDLPHLDLNTTEDIKRLQNGMIKRDLEDVKCLIRFYRMEYTGWNIVSIIPENSLLTSVHTVRNIIFLTLIICLLVSLLLAYIVTLSISLPLTNLKKTMTQFNGEIIDLKYIDNKKDDIGILGNKFNEMIQKIDNLIRVNYREALQRKSEEFKRKQAELDALQMQINPHFLYNTLDVIRWKTIIIEKGDGEVSKMISEFSQLLRLSTKKTDGLVEIREEFEHVAAYLKVISFSYDESFTVEWLIENDSLKHSKVPKLTIQPIIENIVVHAFTNCEHKKIIKVRAYTTEKNIVIIISDNGKGIDRNSLNEVRDRINSKNRLTKNIGLKNVNERIKLTFGEKYGLSIYSESGSGTEVIIRIPLIE